MKKGQRKAAPRGEGPSRRNAKATQRTPKSKRRPSNVDFAGALRSFLGHLEGTAKSAHTVDAYRFDLQDFAAFLQGQRGAGAKGVPDPRQLSRKDLERYHDALRAAGQKTNTRRRKLMTVRKFMHYLTARKKLELDIAKKLPAPEKIERVPETVDALAWTAALATLPQGTPLALRNFALLSFLLDTGASVSEVADLRWSAIDFARATVRIAGKSERELALRPATLSAFAEMKRFGPARDGESERDLCFVGYNRFGPIRIGKKSMPITSRGIELLVKGLAAELGFAKVTPRVLRHSAVVAWYREGANETEIQRRLGLKTAYSFRIYAPIFARIDAAGEGRTA